MSGALRVLLVEDLESDAKLVLRALQQPGRVVEAERIEDEAALRAALARGGWDIVLCDWTMPRFSALGALRVLRELGSDLPFVIVSGSVGEEQAVEAMRAGARDYVIKDRLARLAPVVERELEERDDRRARRVAEDALRAQEARFRAMIERSEEGMSLLAPDGTTLYVNAAGQNIGGYSAEQSVGINGFETIHPDDRERVATDMMSMIELPGATANTQLRVRRPDGTYRWVETTSTNLLADPDIGAIVSNFRDITERKRALDELAASEARYRRIVETTNEGIWTVDAHGRTTFVNGRMAAMLGCPAEAIMASSPFDFAPDEGVAALLEYFPRVVAGESMQIESQMRRADGTMFWALLELSPVLDASGRYDGALAMVMDITPRKRVEAALHTSETRFRGLWDSGLMVIAITDSSGRIASMNPAGLRLLGFSEAELADGSITWKSLTPVESLVADQQAREQLARAGVATPFEREVICKDGRRVPLLVTSTRLEGREVISVALDISERHAAQTALHRTEDQLRQAQKMEAVGRLAGGIAHDFNNMLSVILSLADLLLADLHPGEPMREDVDEIRKAGQRAADLTRQLLMFSRQQVLQPVVLDLNALLADLDRMLRRIVGEDIDVATLAEPALGRVRADAGSIEQVLMNLVVNARDAMPTGGKLTIETRNTDLDESFARAHHGVVPGPHVMIAVTDTGIGMDKATLARVFEPFFTTKEKGKGTGLGLSTVFGIVQQSGGTIWIYSEPGVGTTFKIYLPRIDAAAEAVRPTARPAALRGSETVLIVEDEEAVRAVAVSILRRHGYVVLEASGPGVALETCAQHPAPIHLLLTDVVMPQMSGPELARRLALIRPEMKTLFMSGYTDDSIVRHGVLDAVLAFVQKPFTPESLTRKVREVLGAK